MQQDLMGGSIGQKDDLNILLYLEHLVVLTTKITSQQGLATLTGNEADYAVCSKVYPFSNSPV